MGVAGFRTAAERTSADGGPAACSFVHLHATSRRPMRQLLKITFTLALALVFTAGMAFGQSNNTADITQNEDNNVADIEQIGDNNESDITQTSAAGLSVGHDADVLQDGDGNNSFVDQSMGTQFTNQTFLTDIDQLGNGNDAVVEQAGDIGFQSNATIFQDGNNNDAGVSTGNGGGSFAVTQIGDGNKVGGFPSVDGVAAFRQEPGVSGPFSTHNALTVTQDGDQNEVFGFQTVGENRATVDQFGDDNYLRLEQTNSVAAAAPNRSTVTQDGFSNEATVIQSQ
jgi:hypothetical protein